MLEVRSGIFAKLRLFTYISKKTNKKSNKKAKKRKYRLFCAIE